MEIVEEKFPNITLSDGSSKVESKKTQAWMPIHLAVISRTFCHGIKWETCYPKRLDDDTPSLGVEFQLACEHSQIRQSMF